MTAALCQPVRGVDPPRASNAFPGVPYLLVAIMVQDKRRAHVSLAADDSPDMNRPGLLSRRAGFRTLSHVRKNPSTSLSVQARVLSMNRNLRRRRRPQQTTKIDGERLPRAVAAKTQRSRNRARTGHHHARHDLRHG